MTPQEAERLQQILAGHEADDVAFVFRLVQPWRARKYRYDTRDDAIRAARPLFNERDQSAALAKALRRYLASRWKFEQQLDGLPEAASELHKALHRIARLNDGEPLSGRMIGYIFNGTRGR